MDLLNHVIICLETLATLWQFHEHLFAEGTASSSISEWRYHNRSSHHSRCLTVKFMMAIFVSHQPKTISLLRKELFHHQNLQGQREFVEHLCETIYLVFEFELARFHELWTQIGCEPSNSVTVKLGEGKTWFFEQGKIDWFLFDWYDPETHCKFVSSNLFQTIKDNSSPRCVWSCLFWFRCYAWCSIFTVIWPILEVHFIPNLNPMVLISRI